MAQDKGLNIRNCQVAMSPGQHGKDSLTLQAMAMATALGLVTTSGQPGSKTQHSPG